MKTNPESESRAQAAKGYREMIVKLVTAKAILIAVVVLIILTVRQCAGF